MGPKSVVCNMIYVPFRVFSKAELIDGTKLTIKPVLVHVKLIFFHVKI